MSEVATVIEHGRLKLRLDPVMCQGQVIGGRSRNGRVCALLKGVA